MKEKSSSTANISLLDPNSSPYTGQLLIAHPSNPDNRLSRSVIMLMHVPYNVTVLGFQLNCVFKEAGLRNIMENLGFYLDYECPVYFGGIVGTNKLHFIHSLDWQGMSTIDLGNNLGLTSDISILAALMENSGPEYFKACAGNWLWNVDGLQDQLSVGSNSDFRWGLVPANIKRVFEYDGIEQWDHLCHVHATQCIDTWFNRVQS